MTLFRILFVSLVLTLTFEGAFAVLWGLRDPKDYRLLLLANIATNPAVNLIHYGVSAVFPSALAPVTAVLEISAVLAEWLCYRRFSHQLTRPFLFSLAANGFSYGLGCLINIL